MKTKITATFANGEIIIYHGTRAVTAAWKVTNIETGKSFTGFSMTAELAASTSKNKVREQVGADVPAQWWPAGQKRDYAKAAGFASVAEMVEIAKSVKDKHEANHHFEIVDVK